MSSIQERDVLQSCGFRHVIAGGSPILYADATSSAKIDSSVVIMPRHSTRFVRFPFTHRAAMQLLDQAHAIGAPGAEVALCIYGEDISTEEWTQFAMANGIKWIVGAVLNDENALQRMSWIFSRYEHVVTDALGSHIVYAAHFGCTVWYVGTGAVKYRRFTKDPFYSKGAHGRLAFQRLQDRLEGEHETAKNLGLVDAAPRRDRLKAMSQECLGVGNRLSDHGLMDLVGTSLGNPANRALYLLDTSRAAWSRLRSE